MAMTSAIPQVGSLGQTSPGLVRSRGSFVAEIAVSVLTSERHTIAATPTDTAIESGATVTDHIVLKPGEVTIDFGMANTGGGSEAARSAFDQFKKLVTDRQPFDLITEHQNYKNVVATNFTGSHDAPFKGALACTVTLRQITRVEMEKRGRANASGSASKRAGAQVNAGRQDGKKVPSDSIASELKKKWGWK